MSRGTDAAVVAAARSARYARVYLAALDFLPTPVLVHSWDFFSLFFDYDGDLIEEEFKGVGRLGGIAPIEEGTELKSNTITLLLAGVPKDRTDELLAVANYRNRQAQLWEAWLDRHYQVIGTPRRIFRGVMDAAAVRYGDDATIELPVHSRLVKWEDPKIDRYTDSDQQNKFPGDRGLEFLQEMSAGREIPWGRG